MKRLRRRYALIILVVAIFAAGVGAWLAYEHLAAGRSPAEQAAVATGAPPTFKSQDDAVQLHVPDGAMTPGTQVDFAPLGPDVTNDFNRVARGVVAASTPIDIQVTRGFLSPEKTSVTLHYSPALFPAGSADQQVGMAVFDDTLQSWIPLMDAKVDPAAHTVTATGPHFSRFIAMVLDKAKAAVDLGGKVIQTVIDVHTTVSIWLLQLASKVTELFVKDLFGIPPKLACRPTTNAVVAKPTSLANFLGACTQTGSGKDVTVRLRNGFAFPLRTAELPAGTTQRDSDIRNNGEDLVNLVRNFYWAGRHKAVLAGTSIGSVTATTDLTRSATVKMDIDGDAIAFDMVLAVLTIVAPEVGVTKSAVKAGAASLAKGTGAIVKGEKAASWLETVQNALDCVIHAKHVDTSKAFTKEGISAQADVAYGCLNSAMDALHLKSALADLIGQVKVIPEVIETVLYPIAGDLANQLGLYTQGPPSVLLTRNQDQIDSTFVGHWWVHGATLDITKSGSGQLQWNAGPCESATASMSQLCSGNATIKFQPGQNGQITGTYTKVWYTDSGGHTMPSSGSYVSTDIEVNGTFWMKRNDPHTLITGGSNTGDSNGPGNPYFCDEYAAQHNTGGSSQYGICGA